MEADSKRALALFTGSGTSGQQGGEARASATEEKTVQKAVVRRTVDHTASYLKLAQARLAYPHLQNAAILQPLYADSQQLLPPEAYLHLPASNFDTKFVVANLNKLKASVNHVLWTPDGRRCMTGASSGEFTTWDARSFAWESVLQAHESPVRCMQYTHAEHIIISSDDNGRIKLWSGRRDNYLDPLHVINAHREPCRCVTLAPTDRKFASASDDSTIKVHDFVKGGVEATMMGHGGDVRWVEWHPWRGLLASASKDALVKLWDPRSGGQCLATLHGHKNGVMQVRWNPNNGHWLLSSSRDQLLKVFDVRMLREVASYAGHARDVTCCTWHPVHEELFASGSHDGTIAFWLVSHSEPQALLQGAHDKEVWSLAWHPVGHVLASGSNDLFTKFWTRTRPGDFFRDRAEDSSLPEGLEAQGLPCGEPHSGASAVHLTSAPGLAGAIPGIGMAGSAPRRGPVARALPQPEGPKLEPKEPLRSRAPPDMPWGRDHDIDPRASERDLRGPDRGRELEWGRPGPGPWHGHPPPDMGERPLKRLREGEYGWDSRSGPGPGPVLGSNFHDLPHRGRPPQFSRGPPHPYDRDPILPMRGPGGPGPPFSRSMPPPPRGWDDWGPGHGPPPAAGPWGRGPPPGPGAPAGMGGQGSGAAASAWGAPPPSGPSGQGGPDPPAQYAGVGTGNGGPPMPYEPGPSGGHGLLPPHRAGPAPPGGRWPGHGGRGRGWGWG